MLNKKTTDYLIDLFLFFQFIKKHLIIFLRIKNKRITLKSTIFTKIFHTDCREVTKNIFTPTTWTGINFHNTRFIQINYFSIIKLWYNSLPQYGQIKPSFSSFLDFIKGFKNSIPQLLHLYFFRFRIAFFLIILYIFEHIHLTNSFPILGGKKTSDYLDYEATLSTSRLLHSGHVNFIILFPTYVSFGLSKRALQFLQWNKLIYFFVLLIRVIYSSLIYHSIIINIIPIYIIMLNKYLLKNKSLFRL